MPLFDRFIFVDWSANSTPNEGANSIWIAEGSTAGNIQLENPHTRHLATQHVMAALQQAVAHNQRVLVGFDFAYSYPKNVLQHMRDHGGPGSYIALWQALHERIQDDVDNENNRFVFAACANEHWFAGPYYWGVPHPQFANQWLLAIRHPTHLSERRLAELTPAMTHTQPTRKLAYPGSVGSQALLGMRRLHEFHNHPILAPVSHIWPMTTGFALPNLPQGTAALVHAEIYPTPIVVRAQKAGIAMPPDVADMVPDAQQVWACAALARHEDQQGNLAGRFAIPQNLVAGQVGQAMEEGWILWG